MTTEPGAAPEPTVAWQPPAPVTPSRLVPGAESLEYSGAIPRLAAYFLDALVLVVTFVAVAILALAIGLPGLAAPASPVISLAYFVYGWRNEARGTPGMRLMKVAIGNIADGTVISTGTAVIRWLLLVGWSQILSVVPRLSGLAGLLALVWIIALLISVVADPRHQGLHDRITGTGLVRPAGASQTGALIIVGVLIALPVLAFLGIVVLIFLGSQVSDILQNSR